MTKNGGFTLIEVLVALIVASIAFTSLFRAFGSYADTVYALQTRTAAELVGWNAYVLFITDPQKVGIRQNSGTETVLDRQLRWLVTNYEAGSETALLKTDIDAARVTELTVLHNDEIMFDVIALDFVL